MVDVHRNLRTGTIGLRKGPMMAASDNFRIDIRGRGGHAARPHNCLDPVVAGAEMVPRKAVLHTLERIHDTGARILGVVLNRAQVDKHSYYYSHYYGHYYGEYYGKTKTPGRPSRPADSKVTSIDETRARA